MPSLASSLETAARTAVSADRLSPTTVAAQSLSESLSESLSDNTSLTASSMGQVGQAGQFATVPPGQLGVYSKTMVGVMEGKIIVEEVPGRAFTGKAVG